MEARISASRSQGVSTHKRQKPRSTGEGLMSLSLKFSMESLRECKNNTYVYFFTLRFAMLKPLAWRSWLQTSSISHMKCKCIKNMHGSRWGISIVVSLHLHTDGDRFYSYLCRKLNHSRFELEVFTNMPNGQ